MDYVKLLLLFRSTIAGLKIVSDAIVAVARQQNYDGSALCVLCDFCETYVRTSRRTSRLLKCEMKVSKLAPKTQARQNRFRLWGNGCGGKGGSRKSDRMSYRTSRDVNPQNRVESAIHSNLPHSRVLQSG
jgi:hypothetical protein